MAADPRNTISHSFELRHFSADAAANGPTDFKGETAVFDTGQRLGYLRDYAAYAGDFFEDPGLDTPAVADEDVDSLMAKLKPPPLPRIRSRLRLDGWRRLEYRAGQEKEDQAKLDAWRENRAVEVGGGFLKFVEAGCVTRSFDPQTWRLRFEWKQRGPVRKVAFHGDGKTVATVVLAAGPRREWVQCVVEIDLAEKRWNVMRDGAYDIDWQTLDGDCARIDAVSISADPEAEVAGLWGRGFHPRDDPRNPYSIRTFLDETFSVRPHPADWHSPAYDDSAWKEAEDPLVHGSERHVGEDLYLRTAVAVEDAFEKAWLDIETLDPGGEVWVNGKLVAVSRNRHPLRLDVTDFVAAGRDNLVAVKVYPNDPEMIGRELPHSGIDANIGWFAGRMHLDLTHHAWVDDLFAYTTAVTAGAAGTPQALSEEFNAETAGRVNAVPAEQATVKVRATICNRDCEERWRGYLRIRLYPWLPEESGECAAEQMLPVDCCEWRDLEMETDITVKNPSLWTWRSPALYKVEAVLMDADEMPVDDNVLTTGLRTVSQTGGVLRVNNQPEMLNGAQIFGLRAPQEMMATWQRRPPVHWLVREMAQIRRMNGNAMRIHVHAWAHVPPARNINDVRLAEIGDQLGIMFYWATTAWVRSGTPWGVDLEGLPKYIRQVRNHPSIVLWELSNHPTCNQLYDRGPDGWNEFYLKAHDIVHSLDPSRLLAPSAIVGEGGGATPALELPGMVRGDMDTPTGMGTDWSVLRRFRESKRRYFEERKNHAYFNFEHQESIGQPNWELCRGKPWYRVMSYEWESDEGSIGRKLSADEWRESQAWQAFSAYEAMRIMRQMGYDGFSWCCLHGGPNDAAYKKPLIDFLGHPKLAWYIHRMIFQRVVAGSDDIDVVYGPNDWIHPVVQNLGPERIVNVEVTIEQIDGSVVESKVYSKVKLPPGRSITSLPAFRPTLKIEGNHAVKYKVLSDA